MIQMNEIEEYTEKIFGNIKHFDEFGNQYWEARELMHLFEYSSISRKKNCINIQ